MKKYRDAAEKKLAGKVHPDVLAKEALVKAQFAKIERESFFNDAYGELLTDYFIQFLNTEPHETRAREFIYSCVLSLGDVKTRLAQYETYGSNVPYMSDNNDEDNE